MSDPYELADGRREHLAKCAAVNKPLEYAADDPARQANVRGGAHRADAPGSTVPSGAVARGPHS